MKDNEPSGSNNDDSLDGNALETGEKHENYQTNDALKQQD